MGLDWNRNIEKVFLAGLRNLSSSSNLAPGGEVINISSVKGAGNYQIWFAPRKTATDNTKPNMKIAKANRSLLYFLFSTRPK